MFLIEKLCKIAFTVKQMFSGEIIFWMMKIFFFRFQKQKKEIFFLRQLQFLPKISLSKKMIKKKKKKCFSAIFKSKFKMK